MTYRAWMYDQFGYRFALAITSCTERTEMSEISKCVLCGEPMPRGEEMFKFHGYSGPCPKASLPSPPTEIEALYQQLTSMEDKYLVEKGMRRLNSGESESLRQQLSAEIMRLEIALRIKTEEHKCCSEDLMKLRESEQSGWKEAAIAWEVCGSIHEAFAKKKDALYSTRHSDFERHAEDARRMLSTESKEKVE